MPESIQHAQHYVWPVRVYYEDTDSAGVVYYANYLRYFERARTEWLRAQGFEQTQLAEQLGVVFVVRSIQVDYLLPARFNDELVISVELAAVGASQITMHQGVARSAGALTQKLVQAQVLLVCVSRSAMKPVKIPKMIRAKISDKTTRTP